MYTTKKRLDKEFVRKVLIEHYTKNYTESGDQYLRKLNVHSVSNFPEAYVLTIEGSGPKGYAFYFPSQGKYTLTLFDCRGEAFKHYYLFYEINFD